MALNKSILQERGHYHGCEKEMKDRRFQILLVHHHHKISYQECVRIYSSQRSLQQSTQFSVTVCWIIHRDPKSAEANSCWVHHPLLYLTIEVLIKTDISRGIIQLLPLEMVGLFLDFIFLFVSPPINKVKIKKHISLLQNALKWQYKNFPSGITS